MIKLYAVLILLALALLLLPSVRRALLGLLGRAGRGRDGGSGTGLGGLAALRDEDARRELARQAREHGSRAAEQARAAAGTAREAAGAAVEVARGTAGAVHDAADSVAQGISDRRYRAVGRTVTAEGAPADLSALLAEAVGTVAVVDPVAPRPGESQAWLYSGTGDIRFAARPGPASVPTTVLGAVELEVVMGEPQGGPVAGQVLDAATRALDAAGVRWTEAVLTFVPGPEDATDGPRRLP